MRHGMRGRTPASINQARLAGNMTSIKLDSVSYVAVGSPVRVRKSPRVMTTVRHNLRQQRDEAFFWHQPSMQAALLPDVMPRKERNKLSAYKSRQRRNEETERLRRFYDTCRELMLDGQHTDEAKVATLQKLLGLPPCPPVVVATEPLLDHAMYV